VLELCTSFLLELALWLVGLFVGWLVDWLVGWLIGFVGLFRWSVGW